MKRNSTGLSDRMMKTDSNTIEKSDQHMWHKVWFNSNYVGIWKSFFRIILTFCTLVWQFYAHLIWRPVVTNIENPLSLNIEEVVRYNHFVISAFYIPCIVYFIMVLLSSLWLIKDFINQNVNVGKYGIITIILGLFGFYYSFYIFTQG